MLEHIPIIILCGGQGTRLRSVLADRPKVLAPFENGTLLDILMRQLNEQGFTKIILSVGHLKEHIINHCAMKGYDVIFSEEDTPLGTGGAVRVALKHINSECFFVMNGDMIFNPDFKSLYKFHREKNGLMSFTLTRRYIGQGGHVVSIDNAHRIVGWREKNDSDQGKNINLNAGTYIMTRDAVSLFPDKKQFSLEHEFFPIAFNDLCYGFETDTEFIDIGVPDRYEQAKVLLNR